MVKLQQYISRIHRLSFHQIFEGHHFYSKLNSAAVIRLSDEYIMSSNMTGLQIGIKLKSPPI